MATIEKNRLSRIWIISIPFFLIFISCGLQRTVSKVSRNDKAALIKVVDDPQKLDESVHGSGQDDDFFVEKFSALTPADLDLLAHYGPRSVKVSTTIERIPTTGQFRVSVEWIGEGPIPVQWRIHTFPEALFGGDVLPNDQIFRSNSVLKTSFDLNPGYLHHIRLMAIVGGDLSVEVPQWPPVLYGLKDIQVDLRNVVVK